MQEVNLNKRTILFFDAPGGRNFKHVIQACATSDAAILVLDASPGVFEQSLSSAGVTKEHLIIA
jgi:elongation factor 1 alpha-like protein